MQEIKEEWRDIAGYENLYQVSNLGRVKALGNGKTHNSKEHLLKPEKDIGSYLRVRLSKQGKQKHYKIHRLVAEAFIPNPKNLPEINHRNESKTDNRASNIEWCTRLYNHNYGTINQRISKSLSKKVMCIETNKVYCSVKEAKNETKLNHIDAVCRGKRKTCGGFHWQYVE